MEPPHIDTMLARANEHSVVGVTGWLAVYLYLSDLGLPSSAFDVVKEAVVSLGGFGATIGETRQYLPPLFIPRRGSGP
jgi:hypothetical protein